MPSLIHQESLDPQIQAQRRLVQEHAGTAPYCIRPTSFLPHINFDNRCLPKIKLQNNSTITTAVCFAKT